MKTEMNNETWRLSWFNLSTVLIVLSIVGVVLSNADLFWVVPTLLWVIFLRLTQLRGAI